MDSVEDLICSPSAPIKLVKKRSAPVEVSSEAQPEGLKKKKGANRKKTSLTNITIESRTVAPTDSTPTSTSASFLLTFKAQQKRLENINQFIRELRKSNDHCGLLAKQWSDAQSEITCQKKNVENLEKSEKALKIENEQLR
uniref:Uncharacterized protein n=1 Tax=Cannabis sativa TaxID=3483 RepID=A0A803QSL8_CANSA